MNGIFHHAHEVNVRNADGSVSWVATFSTKGLADWYVTAVTESLMKMSARVPRYEVVPV